MGLAKGLQSRPTTNIFGTAGWRAEGLADLPALNLLAWERSSLGIEETTELLVLIGKIIKMPASKG
jgi:hypothetical protein